MNPHRRYKNYMGIQDILLIILPIVLVLFAVFGLNPTDKKNAEKLKPIDRTKIVSIDINGTVESIHPWGRTEVVPMKSVELEYFEYCDQWVMYGDVVQPDGRKDYFMPVMRGHLDLNVKHMTETWVEYGSYATGPQENEKTYEDFRMAHIKIINAKISDIEYSHYRLSPNNTWSIICSWQAKF